MNHELNFEISSQSNSKINQELKSPSSLQYKDEVIFLSQEIIEVFDFLKSGINFSRSQNKNFIIEDQDIFEFFKSVKNILIFPSDQYEYDFLDFLGYSKLHEYYPRNYLEFLNNEELKTPFKKLLPKKLKTCGEMNQIN